MNMHMLVIFFSGVLPLSSTAFIYHAQVLRGWVSEKGAYQYVIGLSDYHDKKHHANNEQRISLERLLRSCDCQNTKILVEDLSSINNMGRQICGNFMVDSRGGILGGLSTLCKQMHLPVTNIEYRYCRVAAFAPVLNKLNSHFAVLRSPNAIRMQAIKDEIMQEIKQIRAYKNIPAALQADYAKLIARILKKMQLLGMHEYQNLSAAQYLKKLDKTGDHVQRLIQLLTFDSSLLDLKMVYEIINDKNQPMIIAVAGGSHIKQVSRLLKKIGYKEVYKSKITRMNEYNLKKCLGSNIINGSHCVKPKAIDLYVIGKFLREN